MRRAAWGLMLLVALAGCYKKALSQAPVVPERTPTPGDELLTLMPAGAAVIVEIDAGRMRRNAAVGPLVTAVNAHVDSPDDPELVKLALGILRHAESAAIGIYDPGTDKARMLVLLRDLDAARVKTAVRLNDHTHALGPPELTERAREMAGGAPRPSVADDPELMSMRAAPMPEGATGAALRATARLSFDARVQLASRFELDAVPEKLALWGDVADDLAVVVHMAGKTSSEAQQLAQAVLAVRDRARRQPAPVRVLLQPVTAGTEAKAIGGVARATLVIGPRQLAWMVERLVVMLGGKPPAAPPPPPPPETAPPAPGTTPPPADAPAATG